MNWWKTAQLQSFEDRNIWNDKIDDLKAFTVILDKLAKQCFQTGTGTRAALGEMIGTKRLSSFPLIEQMIVTAQSVVLDSPQRCSVLCTSAAREIITRVKRLEVERKAFVYKKDSGGSKKGWNQND